MNHIAERRRRGIAGYAPRAARKLNIGYWKPRVHQRHPTKVWQDSHTPAATTSVIPFNALAWPMLALIPIAYAVSAIPFLAFIAQRDSSLLWPAPALIMVRAIALSAGLVAGVGREVLSSRILKRAVDIVGACLGLALTAPLLPLIALAV